MELSKLAPATGQAYPMAQAQPILAQQVAVEAQHAPLQQAMPPSEHLASLDSVQIRQDTGDDTLLAIAKAAVPAIAGEIGIDPNLVNFDLRSAAKYRVVDGNKEPVFMIMETTGLYKLNKKKGLVSRSADIIYTCGGTHQRLLTVNMDAKGCYGLCPTNCCLSCCPRMNVSVLDSASQHVAFIQRKCCGLRYSIKDTNHVDILKVNGPCCCLKDWNPCCCFCFCPKPNSQGALVTLNVRGSGFNGSLERMSPWNESSWGGMFKEAAKKVVHGSNSNYEIKFATASSAQLKELLIAFAVFFDFRFFTEETSSLHNVVGLLC